jgi:hypothetical protein
MLLFPLTWLAIAIIAWRFSGGLAALLWVIIASLCGYGAVRFFEEIDRFYGSFAALALFVLKRRYFVRMLAERAAIREEIISLGEDAAQVAVD